MGWEWDPCIRAGLILWSERIRENWMEPSFGSDFGKERCNVRILLGLCVLMMAVVSGGGCDAPSPSVSSTKVPLVGSGDNATSSAGSNLDLGGAHTNPRSSYGAGLRYLRAPQFRELTLPELYGANAIWGATGRDKRGRMYFGVASSGVEDPSARLVRYEPRENRMEDLGGVNEELAKLKLRRMEPFAETQMKIHSKIIEAGDGRLYFSSQDEHDEQPDGSKPPLFGGRLFALDASSNRWDCVLTAPEGLIAVAAGKRYVYAMGYFGHVIYQYDVVLKSVRSMALGTFRGHISRNFFVDAREHVFAVRLVEYPGVETAGVTQVKGIPVRATLVELDQELKEVAEWPLEDYQPTDDADSHGMTGYARLLDGSTVFVTHSGALWRVTSGSRSSKLERLGWVHPDGAAYCASLFCPTGGDYVMGFTNQKDQPFEWFVFDLSQRRSTLLRLDLEGRKLAVQDGLLLYGCETLDDAGRGYAVGWKRSDTGHVPCAFQLSWEGGR
jgi:hypothetical protein